MKECASTLSGSKESKTCIEDRSFAFDENTQNLLLVSGIHDGSTSPTGKKVSKVNDMSYLGVKLGNGVKRNDFTDSGLDNNETNRMAKSVIPEKSESSVKNMDARVYPEPANCVSYMICDEEKELAFLRSLGWDEHAEEEPLTEEEINAFYQQHNACSHGKRRL